MRRPKIDEATLRRLYCDENLSGKKIGEMYQCSQQTILRLVRKYGLQAKSAGPYAGHLNPHWKGGLTMQDGYILQYAPHHPSIQNCVRPYVPQHRLVMEKHLGRYLTETEVVHHKNEIRTDNRIENLELLPDSAAHNRLHLCGQPTPLTPEGRKRKGDAARRQRKFFLPADELRALYVEKLQSTREIAEHFHCSSDVVERGLREIGIPLRSRGKVRGKAQSLREGLL